MIKLVVTWESTRGDPDLQCNGTTLPFGGSNLGSNPGR